MGSQRTYFDPSVNMMVDVDVMVWAHNLLKSDKCDRRKEEETKDPEVRLRFIHVTEMLR